MQRENKYIGLLGLGSHSTTYYLKQLNAQYNLLNGGFSTCPLKLLNVNFELINPYLPHDFSRLEPTVKESIEKISQLGIECLVIPNITLHETIDRIDNLGVKIIHPVLETAKLLKRKDVKKVLVLGSIFTMKGDYIAKLFSQYDISVIQPSDIDMCAIDNLRKVIYENGYSVENKTAITKIIDKYTKLAPVLLCCTELSLVMESYQYSRLFDLVQIQIEAAIDTLFLNE